MSAVLRRRRERVRRIVKPAKHSSGILAVRRRNQKAFENFFMAKGGRLTYEFAKLSFRPSIVCEFPIKKFHYPNGAMKDFHQKFNSFFLKAQDFEPEREFFLFLMDNFDQLPKTYALKIWKQIVSPSRRVGRPRAVRNPETGKIVNAERGVRQVIDGWESGSDVESIRCLKYPKTRMPPQKKFEIGKIRRILRRYKHLLNRPYDTK